MPATTKVVLITGASSGFGRPTAPTPARAGHVVAAGMRATQDRNAAAMDDDRRPFRTHVDPSRDGSEVVSAVADRIRTEFYHRLGIDGLLASNASL